MKRSKKQQELRNYYMVETIRPQKYDRLSINWDCDRNSENVNNRFAVMLHVPDMAEHEHSHIKLSDKQAKKLRDWLDKFLKMKTTAKKARR